MENLSKVTKVIRNHVLNAGGRINVEDLVSDYSVAYSSSIPFQQFGYRDLLSFLKSIRGIHIVNVEGTYDLVCNHSPNMAEKKNDSVSQLCHKMENKLIVNTTYDACRKVTISSSCEKTNLSNRRYIMQRMSLYSNTSSESISSEESHRSSTNALELTHCDLPETGSSLGAINTGISDNIFEKDSHTSSASSGFASKSNTPEPTYDNDQLNFPASTAHSFNYFDLYNISKNYEPNSAIQQSDYGNQTDLFGSSASSGVTWNQFDSSEYANYLCHTKPSHSLFEPTFGSLETFVQQYGTCENSENDIISKLIEVINSTTRRFDINGAEIKNDYGVNSKIIEDDFIKKYNIAPPWNWINLIENTASIYIDTLPSETIMYPRRIFLNSTPLRCTLPSKQYPRSDVWKIHIVRCVNTKEIWFRCLDDFFSRKYHNLTRQMNHHYNGQLISNVTHVKPEELYAYLYQSQWCRIEVRSVQGSTVIGHFIDLGYETEIPFSSLFPLNHMFTNTPPLALKCALSGLTQFSDINYASCKLIQILNDKIVAAKVDQSYTYDEPTIHMFLENNSVNVSVNEYIQNEIMKELQIPNINKIGKTFTCRLLSVDESGLAKAQIECEALHLLKKSLARSARILEKNNYFIPTSINLDTRKIYLTKLNNKWERVMILVNKVRSITVQFIDVGTQAEIDYRQLVLLDSLPNSLKLISPQCQLLKMKMEDRESKELVQFMYRLFTETKSQSVSLVMKVISLREQPVVEIYKKVSNDQILPLQELFYLSLHQISDKTYVNNFTQILPADLCNIFGDPDNMNLNIPKCELKKGETLEVTVVQVFDPSNFVLRIENIPQLKELMWSLNNYYLIFNAEPVAKISLRQCYAVRLENGLHYRGLALHYFKDDLRTAIIRLLDYGYNVSVPISNVYPLPAKFYSSPVATFSAQLSNVQPAEGNWKQQDCCRFEEMVQGKVLNCIVVDIDTLTKVILLDGTNPHQMTNISTILFNERRAV